MTRPCVYVLDPETKRPMFFCTSDRVGRAVNIAGALGTIFAGKAWVADWRVLGHVPTAADLAWMGVE